MRIVDLSMTVEECDSAPFAPDEKYFKLKQQGVEIQEGGMLLLRTDWPKGHDTTDPKWWNDSPYLTKEAAQWVVNKKPSVVGYDFAQEEKGTDYQQADQILESAMRVHRTILPKVIFQIE